MTPNAAFLVVFTAICFFISYRFYSRYLATKIFQLDDSFTTPAHELNDGVDYVPTKKGVLFGHHYASIAGAAPIVGPAIAVAWGWLPALIWVVLGTIFIGAVHDFGTLVISAKNKGKSIGDLTDKIIGKRARILFLSLVLFLAWIVLAVFASVIAALFVDYPGTVLPINFQIIVAVIIGLVLYRGKGKLLVPSLVALIALYLIIPVGVRFPMGGYTLFVNDSTKAAMQTEHKEGRLVDNDSLAAVLKLPSSAAPLKAAAYFEQAGKEEVAADIKKARGQAIQWWIYLLLIYSFIASILPVWVLLQPRDYINAHQLIVALALLYISVLIARPDLHAPALNLNLQNGPPWFPFLFITIACGAISGFHGLVSSGTTSKQMDKMTDARPIGYGGMLGEGSLALLSLIACTAGFASAEAWAGHYHDWNAANAGGSKIGAFVNGCASLLAHINVPNEIALTFTGMLVIAFSATTLDTATRIQRYVISEWGEATGVKPLSNRYLAGVIAAGTPVLLLIGASWKKLWPVFGATNQMLAALSLLVLAVYLARKKVPNKAVLVPMLFLLVMTGWGLLIQLGGFWKEGNWLLVGVTGILFVLASWISAEGYLAIKNKDSSQPLSLN